MTKRKRIYVGATIAFTVYVLAVGIPLFFSIERFLHTGQAPLVFPLLVLAFVVGLAQYKNYPETMLGRFINGKPLMIDRSNETPYEFDNPYMPKNQPKAERSS